MASINTPHHDGGVSSFSQAYKQDQTFLRGMLILQRMMPPLHENRIWPCETNDLLMSTYHMSVITHEHYLACVACVLEISKLAHKFYSRHTGEHKCNCKLSLELYHNYMPLLFTTLLVIQFQPIGFDICSG